MTTRVTLNFSTRVIQALRRAGLGDAQAAQLAAWAQQLHAAVERMANVKEYRCAAPRRKSVPAAVWLQCTHAKRHDLQRCLVGHEGHISSSCTEAYTAGRPPVNEQGVRIR